MGRPLSPEARAKKEALANRTTEQVFQDAVKCGLESDVAAERVAAIKAYADEHNPNLTEMKDKVKQAEDRAAKAEANLAAVVSERDTAQAILVIAIQSALQGSAAKAELADLRTNFDAKLLDARKELVATAQQHEWKAARAESAAKDTLKEAQSQFGARGLQILLDEMKKIVEQYSVSEPAIESLPAGISPLFLTIFGHSPIKAQLMIVYAKSFPEPNEMFKQTLERHLKARLPVHDRGIVVPLEQLGITPDPMSELGSGPKPIEHLAEKIEVLSLMAERWPGVLQEIQKRVEDEQVRRQSQHLLNHYAAMHAEEQASALRGEGRTSIVPEEPESTVPLSEHLPGCLGKCCAGRGARLSNSMDVID